MCVCVCVCDVCALGHRELPFQGGQKGIECRKHMDGHSCTTHSSPVVRLILLRFFGFLVAELVAVI